MPVGESVQMPRPLHASFVHPAFASPTPPSSLGPSGPLASGTGLASSPSPNGGSLAVVHEATDAVVTAIRTASAPPTVRLRRNVVDLESNRGLPKYSGPRTL